MDNYTIVHPIEWKIPEGYHDSKRAIQHKLNEWIKLFTFFDHNQTIKFQTEGPLIPENNGKEPVLILLSNPHPHSIKQGMFLSPNRSGHANPFWETLGSCGYFKHTGPINSKVMIRNEYDSPFRFFMAVLIPFPSEYPADLKEIFGLFLYDNMVKDGASEIKRLIIENNIRHVICFGKMQFESVTGATMSYPYIESLQSGENIKKRSFFSPNVFVYLTYPTGWRYASNSAELKTKSLKRIFESISGQETTIPAKPTPAAIPEKDRQENINLQGRIWFVVHRMELWDIDNKMIGFWNPNQWQPINVGDIVIYYRTGVKRIMGVFRVVEKDIRLNKDFKLPHDLICEETKHQCRMEPICKEIICSHPTRQIDLSFHPEWERNLWGLRKQLYKATIQDLYLIMPSDEVEKLMDVVTS